MHRNMYKEKDFIKKMNEKKILLQSVTEMILLNLE